MNYKDNEAVEYDGPANPDRAGYSVPGDTEDDKAYRDGFIPDDPPASDDDDDDDDDDDCNCCDPFCPCPGRKQLRFI